uniref:Uncharacterized protein n=1 Tax=Eutreptiella gymnastica TaxID=73025 RepID=A0A7S1IQ51_9EUGL|mmetsp:Transcript_35022/g.62588  ORF Transcript_35022/g.62588 Transcript_35022/m.62588 type:complete len:109 (+) Transcript_35022:313-639(+)
MEILDTLDTNTPPKGILRGCVAHDKQYPHHIGVRDLDDSLPQWKQKQTQHQIDCAFSKVSAVLLPVHQIHDHTLLALEIVITMGAASMAKIQAFQQRTCKIILIIKNG